MRAFLEADHSRLDQLLVATAAGDAIDMTAYAAFRGGLLRHIGMEEKILLPAAKRLHGDEPLPQACLLRADHAALAALLVPTPTRALLERIGIVLAMHNPVEEGPDGIYAVCERLAAGESTALLAQLQATPSVPLAKHFDGPRAFEGIDRLLRAAGEARGDAELFVRAAPALTPLSSR